MKPLAGRGGKENLQQRKGFVMFRKLLIASVACLGLLSPLAMTSQAMAGGVRYGHARVYRTYSRAGWHRGRTVFYGPGFYSPSCGCWVR